jgi:hypothetical protein
MKPEQLMPANIYQATLNFRDHLQSIISLEGNILESVSEIYGGNIDFETVFKPIYGGCLWCLWQKGQLNGLDFMFLMKIITLSDDELKQEAIGNGLTDRQNVFLFTLKPHLRKSIFGSETEIYKPDFPFLKNHDINIH